MKDRDLLLELLDRNDLSETQREAFSSMSDFLDSDTKRTLSDKQRDWLYSVSVAKGLIVAPSANLHSSGAVPDGIRLPKTRGELAAEKTLSMRPLAPPGRRTA